MSSEEKRKILEDLEKTGFSLEVDVANCLVDEGWFIYPQYGYYDKESEKLRTVDFVGSYPSSNIDSLKPQLAIECKQSDKPWIFSRAKSLGFKSVKGVDVSAEGRTITFRDATSGFDLELFGQPSVGICICFNSFLTLIVKKNPQVPRTLFRRL